MATLYNSRGYSRPVQDTPARDSWQLWPCGSWANATQAIGYNLPSYRAGQLGCGSSLRALLLSRLWPNARVSATVRRREHTLQEKRRTPNVLSACLPAPRIRMLQKLRSG